MREKDKKYYEMVIDAVREVNMIIEGEWGDCRTWDEVLSDEETEIEFKELYDLTIERTKGVK